MGRRLALVAALLALSCTRMPTAPRDVVVAHGTITGPTGEPAAGSYVAFFPLEGVLLDLEAVRDSTLEDPTYTRTDATGAYSFPLVAGEYDMRIYPPNLHDEWLGYANRVRVSPGHERFDYAFHGHRVTGRLYDPDGALVTSGSVQAAISSPYPSYAGSPIQNGIYSLLLPTGTYSFTGRVFDYFSGIPRTTISGLSISSDTTIDVHLVGIPIHGTVIDPGGAPLTRAEVEIWPEVVRTDLTGAYRIFATPGVHAIRCFPPDGLEYILPRTVAMAVESPAQLDFDLGGTTWTGTVRFAGTLAAATGYHVHASTLPPDNRDARALVGPSGEFQLVLQPNLPYDLMVHEPDAPAAFEAHFKATSDTTFDILVPAPPAP